MTVGPKLRVEGLREVSRALRAIDSKAPREVRRVNKRAAEVVQQEGIDRVPRDTGRLANTIKVRASTRSAYVKAGTPARAPYAAVIHWGWPDHNIRARPFLEEARSDKYLEVRDLYAQELEDLAQRYFGQTNVKI